MSLGAKGADVARILGQVSVTQRSCATKARSSIWRAAGGSESLPPRKEA